MTMSTTMPIASRRARVLTAALFSIGERHYAARINQVILASQV
jgi:hypothetical protein